MSEQHGRPARPPGRPEQPAPAATTPNIVFILVDNVGWGDFACYGGMTPTPRIDQLANEGIRFELLRRAAVHADPIGDHDRTAVGSIGDLSRAGAWRGRLWIGAVGI